MNYFVNESSFFIISTIIWALQFFSHISTALINPGIPSRNNFLPCYIKENKINLNEKNPNLQICRLCNIVVNKDDNVSHCEECDLCVIGKLKIN
jgi:hypothetical protein